ncbi:MAG: hypothetical protein RR063_11130 [Anaerovoracaceae bacterium]
MSNQVSNGLVLIDLEMEITNTEGATFDFSGCLCGDYKTDGVDICKFIRNALELDDLFLFDGYVVF